MMGAPGGPVNACKCSVWDYLTLLTAERKYLRQITTFQQNQNQRNQIAVSIPTKRKLIYVYNRRKDK